MTPTWRDRPNVAGLWVWVAPGNKPCAWQFSDADVAKYKRETGRVYGPIPMEGGRK